MTTLNRIVSLLAVGVLAILLALALSEGALAGTLFQSSPPPATVRPTAAPQLAVTSTSPAPLPPTAPAPVFAPATVTPEGFLPAPTLTNPDAVPPVQPSQPGLAAPAAAPEPTAAPAPQGSNLAALIDAAVATLGYAWLCCGGIMLVAAAVVFVWLSRRTPPG